MPEQRRKATRRTVAAVIAVYGAAYPVGMSAEPMVTSSYNLYGVPGLLEMPTAENARDAELSGSFSKSGKQNRTTLTFQFAPRLSGSFRYSKIPNLDIDGDDLYDRSFDLRFQFLDETKWLPSMAVGFQDFIGTGIYSAEYLVATKTFWEDVRVTAGLGWGRLGTGNEITSFGDREYSTDSNGGTLEFDRFFTGPVGVFGGASWNATDKLTLKAEYSSDAYLIETEHGEIDIQTPWNFGAEYRFNPGVSLSAAYLYGSEIGLQLNFTLNPKDPLLGPGNEPAPAPIRPRPPRGSDPAAWSQAWTADQPRKQQIQTVITNVLSKEGIEVEGMSMSGTRAEIRIENNQYLAQSQALGRTARILTRALPASVETFTITQATDGVAETKVSFQRSDLEQLEHASSQAILQRAVFADGAGPLPADMVRTPGYFPQFTWYFAPYLDYSLFDPEDPIRADFGLQLGAEYKLAPGIVATGTLKHKLAGNIDQIDRDPASALPPVRTDFAKYSKATDTYINDLTLAYYNRPIKNVYGRVTAGVLEKMYSGVSGELLWMPVDSRLALGGELNYVVQRDYDGGFGTLDYDIVSGHASVYYDFGAGYMGSVDAGRYLAGDYGATLQLAREFDNGWLVGAFATMTDVSAEDFGEGSFDKGIFIKVPLAWASGQASRSKYGTLIRPLTRDGGAKVNVRGRLFGRVRDTHQPEVEASGGRFWR